MTLVVRGGPGGVRVTPEDARWKYVGFEVVRPGTGTRRDLAGREACVVLLGGSVTIAVPRGPRFELAVRPDPFGGPPRGVYLPPGTTFDLEGDGEVAIGTAPAKRGAALRPLMEPRLEIRGSGAMERRIHHILMEDQEAESLLVTEVVTPGGHWSSYPPHKHDEDDPPRETALEETYYHRLRDPRGFAVQRVYTADGLLDETAAVRDGDLMLVPRGFHTVSAAPGYDSYYLNVMAGPVRRWCVTFDRSHAWLLPPPPP
ncbi:MAG TPA: 5-deoxy-glucuronate isomerase [Candidatus Limnocylindria bacterium]|nr:5-deoxy-glucuronate isomerase [Candidatus Limnocylindria bacterium]